MEPSSKRTKITHSGCGARGSVEALNAPQTDVAPRRDEEEPVQVLMVSEILKI